MFSLSSGFTIAMMLPEFLDMTLYTSGPSADSLFLLVMVTTYLINLILENN